MVTVIICHAAMTGWVTKLVDDEVVKVSRIGKNTPRINNSLNFLPWTLLNGHWPDNAKPKCLYRFHGEVVLDEIVRHFHRVGYRNMRMVVGYRHKLIEDYVEQKGWPIDFVYNPEWGDYYLSQKSMRAGLEDVDDDVIITLGDILPNEIVMDELVASENPLTMSVGHIYKITRDKLPLLDDLPKQGEGYAEIEVPLMMMFRHHGAEEITGISDLDYYYMTDEYKRRVCMNLLSRGWTPKQIVKQSSLGVNLDNFLLFPS